MKVIHDVGMVSYKDTQFRTYIMDDFGYLIPLEGKIQDQFVWFLLTGYVYNKGDIG